MTPEEIMQEARNSISEFCANECGAYCCRHGYLIIDDIQANLIAGDKVDDFMKHGRLTRMENGKLSFFLGEHGSSCPRLGKDFRCTIHSEPNRPQACKDFPIFSEGNRVRFSPRCLATKQGKFYFYEKMLMDLGYELVQADPISKLELYNVTFENAGKDKNMTIKQ